MLTCTALAIGLNLASYHFDRDYPFHETNPGAYAVCDDWVAGAYRNSFGRVSVHAGKILHLGPVGIEIGLATGYGKRVWREPYSGENSQWCLDPGATCLRYEGSAKIIPLIVPSLRLGHARLGLVPPLSSKHRGAVTFSVEWGR